MGQFTHNGVIYRELPDGQVEVVGYEQAAPGTITVGTPNRTKVDAAAADLEGKRLDNRTKAATAEAEARKAVADANKAEADAAAAAAAGRDKPIMDPAIAQAIKGLGLDELLLSVNEARREVGSGRATGIPGALGSLIPGSYANDLRASIDSIQGAVIMEKLQQLKDASKTGASGMGALSEREGARLAASIAALSPSMSAEKFARSLATIERHANALRAVGAGENPDDPEVQRRYGMIVDKSAAAGFDTGGGTGTGPAANPGGGAPPRAPGGLGLSRDGTKAVGPDPALAGVTGKIVSMIKSGRDGGEIREYLESVQPGLGSKVRNLDWWVRFHRANPNEPIRIEPPMIERPLTATESFDNWAAQSAPGAALMAAGDILSGGTLDNMSANPELARAGMAGVAEMNPSATLAGQVGGAVLAGSGVQGLAGRMLGPGAAMLAGDILPGVAYGAGTADDGSRLLGGASGGIAGLMGGVAGRTIGRGVAGVSDEAVRRLSDAGVRMTPGQLAGGFYKRFEDRVAGFPVVGDLIQAQRRRGIEDFNRASFREALEPITQTGVAQIGEAGVGQAQQVIGQAYDSALGGQRVSIDTPFLTDLGRAQTRALNLKRVGPEIRQGIDEIVPEYFDAGSPGTLTGENVQPLLRELREFRSGYRTDPLGNRINSRVEDVEDAITGLFDRQAPDVMPQFNAANEAYSQFAPVQDAVLAAKNTGGVFMPSQLGTQSVRSAVRFRGRNAAARGDRALFELQRAGQDVLPSTIPDSGTAGRLMVMPGALGLSGAALGAGASPEERVEGGAKGFGTGVALSAALASPYLARALIQRAVTQARPAWLQAVGEGIGNYRLPGALALPLLASPGG